MGFCWNQDLKNEVVAAEGLATIRFGTLGGLIDHLMYPIIEAIDRIATNIHAISFHGFFGLAQYQQTFHALLARFAGNSALGVGCGFDFDFAFGFGFGFGFAFGSAFGSALGLALFTA